MFKVCSMFSQGLTLFSRGDFEKAVKELLVAASDGAKMAAPGGPRCHCLMAVSAPAEQRGR
jgi:hypothetical protein